MDSTVKSLMFNSYRCTAVFQKDGLNKKRTFDLSLSLSVVLEWFILFLLIIGMLKLKPFETCFSSVLPG
jgi:lipopolysaccharide/colanic/teichoic acid biosynthesis glycosyltransferase